MYVARHAHTGIFGSWHCVYGAPEECSPGKNKKRMTTFPTAATSYWYCFDSKVSPQLTDRHSGRVLLSARVEQNTEDKPEVAHKVPTAALPRQLVPQEVELKLRALVLMGRYGLLCERPVRAAIDLTLVGDAVSYHRLIRTY